MEGGAEGEREGVGGRERLNYIKNIKRFSASEFHSFIMGCRILLGTIFISKH